MPIHGARALLALLAVLVCCLAAACESTPQPEDRRASLREEGRRVFGGAPAPSQPAPDTRSGSASGAAGSSSVARSAPAPASGEGWTIVLEMYSGPNHARDAANRVPILRRAVGRSDVRVARRPRGSAVVTGSFPGFDDPAASAELERIQGLVISGRRPYATAFLAPPSAETDPGDLPHWSLAAARETYGRMAQYTLQVGVYESPDRETAKRAAEQAALRLRQEGELAFYHHGHTRSMLTIGVFSERDYDERRGIRSPALAALKDRYPLNLLNGQYPIMVTYPGQTEPVQQRSMLVRIPED